jgi:hypothetical protein
MSMLTHTQVENWVRYAAEQFWHCTAYDTIRNDLIIECDLDLLDAVMITKIGLWRYLNEVELLRLGEGELLLQYMNGRA